MRPGSFIVTVLLVGIVTSCGEQKAKKRAPDSPPGAITALESYKGGSASVNSTDSGKGEGQAFPGGPGRPEMPPEPDFVKAIIESKEYIRSLLGLDGSVVENYKQALKTAHDTATSGKEFADQERAARETLVKTLASQRDAVEAKLKANEDVLKKIHGAQVQVILACAAFPDVVEFLELGVAAGVPLKPRPPMPPRPGIGPDPRIMEIAKLTAESEPCKKTVSMLRSLLKSDHQ